MPLERAPRLSFLHRGTRARQVPALAAAFLTSAALAAASPVAGPPESGEAPRTAPTLADSLRPTGVASSPLGVVVASVPEASWAGVRMLEAGGNAVDAAVAAAFALTAADPGGSGIGGQTWMVIRTASGEERAVFCPARAPLRIDRARVRAARQGERLWGPTAAAVPTTVATLAHALRRYGTMSFADVLAPAVEAADAGYRVHELEHLYVTSYARPLSESDVLSPVYLTGPTGESGIPSPVPVGTCVKLHGLAETLRRLAAAGPSDFYTGRIAATLDEEVRAAGGFLSRLDLARVPSSVVDTAPVRGTYRGRTVLSVPAPAGGAVLVMALQILDELPPATLAAPGLPRGHAIVEAVRLARAEAIARRHQEEIADGPLLSEWLTKPWARLQAKRIRPDRALTAGELRGEPAGYFADPGTTHLSVVDARGNAVSLTQSLGRYFGAAWAAPGLGFPLNAFLEALASDDPAAPLSLTPGAVAPVPTAPLLAVQDDRTILVAGTAGSSRIPSILLNLLTGLVDGREELPDASAAPRVIWEAEGPLQRVLLEVAPPLEPEAVPALKAMGYRDVSARTAPGGDSGFFGGVNAVAWSEKLGAWVGVVDARRPGAAAVPHASRSEGP